MFTTESISTIVTTVVEYGLKIILALVIWFFGRWLIGWAVRMMCRLLERRETDPTLIRYLDKIVTVVLSFVLVVGILAFFGIRTISIAAVLAAVGFAIGTAWSGVLANYAAGAFLVGLRPLKVGDFVTAGGVTGTVRRIGVIATTITTLDNVETYVTNSRVLSDNIQNFSVNPYRRVDMVTQLDHSVDPLEAIRLLKERLGEIPNVMAEPAPDVEILDSNLAGTVLAVRPYCHQEHYWQVYFDTNRLMQETFGGAGYPAPKQHYVVQSTT